MGRDLAALTLCSTGETMTRAQAIQAAALVALSDSTELHFKSSGPPTESEEDEAKWLAELSHRMLEDAIELGLTPDESDAIWRWCYCLEASDEQFRSTVPDSY